MKQLMILLFLAMIGAAPAWAGEVRDIELNDGSTITAEVISLAGGQYTLRSEALGTIKLDESKVRAMHPHSSQTASPAGVSAGEVRSLQERMMGDQEIMAKIQSLQNDPEFQKILEDPAVMKAINSGDTTALIANPRFMKLLNNATVQDIQKKVR